jgi:hypothetical protein
MMKWIYWGLQVATARRQLSPSWLGAEILEFIDHPNITQVGINITNFGSAEKGLQRAISRVSASLLNETATVVAVRSLRELLLQRDGWRLYETATEVVCIDGKHITIPKYCLADVAESVAAFEYETVPEDISILRSRLTMFHQAFNETDYLRNETAAEVEGLRPAYLALKSAMNRVVTLPQRCSWRCGELLQLITNITSDYKKLMLPTPLRVPDTWLYEKSRQMWEDTPLFIIARRAISFTSDSPRIANAISSVNSSMVSILVEIGSISCRGDGLCILRRNSNRLPTLTLQRLSTDVAHLTAVLIKTSTECPPGQGRQAPNGPCLNCTMGSFSVPEISLCTLCIADTFGHTTGASECVGCPPGFGSPAGATACSLKV